MAERSILTVMTALVGAAWVYYFAVYLHAASIWQWLALPIGVALGAFTWWRYSGGHTTETAFAEDVPRSLRLFIAVGVTVVGFVGGFILPPTFGANEVPLTLELALGLSFATLWGWIAWNHPTLFYKNRRF